MFDINWSSDGTVVAAGFEKSVVMLDMRQILSHPVDLNQNMTALKGKGEQQAQMYHQTMSSLGPSGESGSLLNGNIASQNLNSFKSKEERRV